MKNKRIDELCIVDIPTQSEVERFKIYQKCILYITQFFFIVAIITSFAISKIVSDIKKEIPEIKLLKSLNPEQSTLIYDLNNKLIANIHGEEDRVIVPLSKISMNLQSAVLAIEDNRFYEHRGIDLLGTFRAIVNNFSGSDSMQGGSTITQQLAKNTFLLSQRSIKRKILEAILAIQIEKNFTKKEILEMYLNQVYWGNLAYGAEKASKKYFKKSASELNLAESALLAGILSAPEGYSPYTNLKFAKLRQKIVLNKMELYGYITHNQRIKAEKESVTLASKVSGYSKYAYFVDYVINTIIKNYGEDIIRKGGLKIYTTLDSQVQEIAENTLNQGIKSIPKSSGISQGAIVSINIKNGYIQSIVGGVDFAKSNYNRAIYSKRAAGSSFKPVVYLTAFRLGKITPESIISDAPISFNTGWSIWRPHNWDNRFMGKMTARKALTLSRNTTTIRVAMKVGIDSIIKTARLVGFNGYIDKNFTIALGSFGISPLEMATIYSTFARDGVYIKPTAIRRIEDSSGNIVEINEITPKRVVSPNFVRELNSILYDVVEKGTGSLAKLPDREVAGKTGTSDEVKDIWFTGYTPDTVTTIWLGNDKNTPLKRVFSSNCAQLWGNFSKEYYKTKKIPPQNFNF